jgi:hypothetical protein
VYGKFGPGVRALGEAINRAINPVPVAQPKIEEIEATAELTDEQIDAIARAGDAKQAEITAVLAAAGEVEDPFGGQI